MKIIMLSGGSGKRLWPLSNSIRSKQFLKVFHDKEGRPQSMLQRIWEQLKESSLASSTLITTSQDQESTIRSQLNNEAEVIVEPYKRDTFPAIALAASYLYSEKKIKEDETIIVLPVDPYVEMEFFEKIKELGETISTNASNLSLLGVKPTFPSEKYGYIVPKVNKNISNFQDVSYFKEKPTKEEALQLIEKNAYWNCGIFAFKLNTLIEIIQKKNFNLNYYGLFSNYSLLPENSFDYEVVEKIENITFVPYEGDWKDLGTWNTLTEQMDRAIHGVGTISNDSENTYLINELSIPIGLLGLKNVIVAASPDGILVTSKQESPRVKEITEKLSEFGRPKFLEETWGTVSILNLKKDEEGYESITKKIKINKEELVEINNTSREIKTLTIINGKGIAFLNNQVQTSQVGESFILKENDILEIKAETDLELIEVSVEVMKEEIKND